MQLFKTLQKVGFLAILFASKVFAAPSTLQIATDKYEYTIGDRALIRAYYVPQSSNPDIEVVFSFVMNGQEFESVNVPGGNGLALTPALPSSDNVVVINAYLQNRKKVLDYEQSITSLNNDVVEFKELKDQESDPLIRNHLQAMIDRNESLVLGLKNKVLSSRKQITSMNFHLSAVSAKMKSGWNNSLVVDLDRESRKYSVGEVMTATARLLSEVRDSNGLHEIWIDSWVEETSTAGNIWTRSTQSSTLSYLIVSPEFLPEDVGRRRLLLQVWTRPIHQAKSLGKAIVDLKKMILSLERESKLASDPIATTYFSNRVAYLGNFVSELDTQLDSAYQLVSDNHAVQFDIEL